MVILALALLVAALGMVLIAVRELLRVLRRLREVTDATSARLQPLIEELQVEAAVSATEAEALQERLAAFQASRTWPGRRLARLDGERTTGLDGSAVG